MKNPQQLVDECYEHLPLQLKAKPWEVTEHGRAVLQTNVQLDAYMAAYGEMHIIKCRAALQNFPFDELDKYPFEVFDWGCGQGIATLTLLSMLAERGRLDRLQKVTLIEPSSYALKRAEQWVQNAVGAGVRVVAVNKFIPQNVGERMDEVSCDTPMCINLFSNILDIRSLSLQWLSAKVASLASTNYMVCVGPKFLQDTNTRIADFCGYFAPESYFSAVSKFPYAYTTRTHHPYGCETRCFVHKRDVALNGTYCEVANEPEYLDPYDYTADCLNGVIDQRSMGFYQKLRQTLGASYEIYFRPSINCDTADFVLVNANRGIYLINICHNIDALEEDLQRIEAVKSSIYNVHLKSLKIDSIAQRKVFYCIKTALFFADATSVDVQQAIIRSNDRLNEQNKERNKEPNKMARSKDYFADLVQLYPDTDLLQTLAKGQTSNFRYAYYEEFVRLIAGKWHSYKDGDTQFRLTTRQKEIVRNPKNRLRVRGCAGSGKTQVVANRAVEQHLRSGDKVLIITFNISLIQYIRMRINQVPADFAPSMFEITNYHQFFLTMAKRYAPKIPWGASDTGTFFEPYKDKIERYTNIIIDEAQDFKEEWFETIIRYFLADGGSVSVFGDGDQNIYDREMDVTTKMPRVYGFRGAWGEMSDKVSMRIMNPSIALLSTHFARTFMDAKSEGVAVQTELPFEVFHTRYDYVSDTTTAPMLASKILGFLHEFKLDTRDVVVLGQSINLLRDLEREYVQQSKARSMINFETVDQYSSVRQNTSPTFVKKDLDDIRRVAKTHFTTDCPELKLSTIHSFKGWESKTVILLLQPGMKSDESFEGYCIQDRENTPALIYTALTRAKCNLFVINMGNANYDSFFRNNMQ